MDVSQSIFEVAQQFLRKARRSGSDNLEAACPFHGDGEERHPSFRMSLTKGVYFCHACHAKGSLYTFFKNLGLDRQTIIMKYGLLVEEASKNIPVGPDPKQPKNIWVELTSTIDESLLGLFDHDINAILPDFAPETLRYFDVGWDGWHQRLTFPIYDMKGSLVALSGRAVHEDQLPRYKIYDDEYRAWDLPVRHGWNKRTVLWNGYRVYPKTHFVAPNQSFIVVVEGFKAAMWVWQAGIENVVALLGSYLSWEQQWLLERLGVPVYLFLDNNNAGRNGQLNAALRLHAKGVPVRIIEYPDRLQEDTGAQPDSLYDDELRVQRACAPSFINWALSRQG